MEKFKYLPQITALYKDGGNIIQFLRSKSSTNENTFEDILISYDFQAGSYIKEFPSSAEYFKNYCGTLAKIIDGLGECNSILEVGVGEATTLSTVIKHLGQRPNKILGFDISWSRLKFAKAFLQDLNIENVTLFTANLFEIPLDDSSIDVVYTSHSVEPNGGKEKEALAELYRIAKKYIVLLEPSFEFADQPARERMKQHGYITNLASTARDLGYKILTHRLFDYTANPLNPTGLLIIEKSPVGNAIIDLQCPISHTRLIKVNDHMLFSEESGLAYPILDGIPCLLKENAILATHFRTDFQAFKETHNLNF